MAKLEIEKLKEMLEKANIPFTYNDDFFRGYHKPSYQIVIFDKDRKRLCDVVYHLGSYGYDEGLLEIMGGLTEEEDKYDEVLGYLTAEEVFKRFKYCYEHNTRYYVKED